MAAGRHPRTSANTFSTPSRRDVIKSAALMGLAAAGATVAGSQYSPVRAAEAKAGGILRFTVLDGNPANSLDPGNVATWADNILHSLMFDPLYTISATGQPEAVLVEHAEADPTAQTWTFRLREAEWHDGKTLSADDLAFTFSRIVDPASPKSGAAGLSTLDTTSFKKLDDRTLQFSFKAPFATLPEVLSTFYFYRVVPVGFDPAKPIGCGPFKFKSFVPGQFGEFTRFDKYWNGAPHLDGVNYVGFTDPIAALNAVKRGELDVFPLAPFSVAKDVNANEVRVLVTKPAQTIAFTMRVDKPPFNDVRVRTALKLLIDREQMVKIAIAGYGEVADDLFANLDKGYPANLHRPHDVAQAKALLKEAGQENLTVELISYLGTIGMPEAAQVFAQNAKQAGVTINVNVVPVDLFYSEYYLKADFSQDYFSYLPYFAQASQTMLPGAPFNSTGWDDPEYNKLFQEAQGTVDPEKRSAITAKLRQIEFDRGGFIVPMRTSVVDLVSAKVQGVEAAPNGYPIDSFAFSKIWLEA